MANLNKKSNTSIKCRKEKELVQEEISEEELDSLPISDTKH